jgi:Flp pilus assembly protein TadD
MLKQEQFESARIYLENALRQNPFNPEHHIHYGDALLAQGDTLLASLHYRQALILDRNNAEAARRMNLLETAPDEYGHRPGTCAGQHDSLPA